MFLSLVADGERGLALLESVHFWKQTGNMLILKITPDDLDVFNL